MLDKSLKPHKDANEIALYFTEVALKEIVLKMDKIKGNYQPNQNNFKLTAFIDTIIQSALALQICQLPLLSDPVYGEITLSTIRVSDQLYKLFDKFVYIFYTTQIDTESEDSWNGFLFQDLLIEKYLCVYYQKTSLLNLTLLVTKALYAKFQRRQGAKVNQPGLSEAVDLFEVEMIKNIEKIQIKQISIYLDTEKFEKKVDQSQKIIQMSNFGSIDEVDDSLNSSESPSQSDKDTKILDESTLSYIELKDGQERKFQCQNILIDKDWIQQMSQTNLPCTAIFYLYSNEEKQEWLRINRALHDLSIEFLPRFYQIKKGTLQAISQPKGYLNHMCDLLRVQIYFILRFELQQPYKVQGCKQLSILPLKLDYDCPLVLTIRQLFDAICIQSYNQEFNQEILRQIYETFHQIAEGSYSEVDPLHYLKVEWLVFMNQNLEDFNVVEMLEQKISLQKVVDNLFKLFAIEFYPEKYVKFFEEMYDLDSINDILMLQGIISKFESKRDEDPKVQSIILVNKAIVQSLAINLLAQSAYKNQQMQTLTLKRITREIDVNVMNQCDIGGANYQFRSKQIQIINQQNQLSTSEFVLASGGALLSHTYQYLKLALALLSRKLICQNPRKIFDILNQSENHNEIWHYQQTYQMSNGHSSFNASFRQVPNFNSNQIQNQCDDCLLYNFQPIYLNRMLLPEQTTILFTILMKKVMQMSQSLHRFTEQTWGSLRSSEIKSLQTLNLSDLKAKLKEIKLKNQVNGTQIIEKYNSIITRFLIFCGQNVNLGKQLIEVITVKQVQRQNSKLLADTREGVIQLKDIPNLQFRLLLLRNIVFFIDPNTESAVYIFELMRETLKAIKVGFQQHESTAIDFSKLVSRIYPNYKQQNSTQFQRVSRDRSMSDLTINEHESYLQKQRSYYQSLAEISISIFNIYSTNVRKGQESIKLFERKSFMEMVVLQVQQYVTAEQTYISDFVKEVLYIFLFKSVEDPNPLKLKLNDMIQLQQMSTINFENQQKIINERLFEYIITTIIDMIKLSQSEEHEDVQITKIAKTLYTIKLTFETLNSRIVVRENEIVREWVTSDMLKLSRSIRPEQLQNLKKILIFLKENSDSPGVDTQHIIKQFTQILVLMFGILPKPQQLRDWFSFIREILYYNQDIDEIDFSLLQDNLQILNSTINLRHKNHHSVSKLKNEMVDYFLFSSLTPGLLLLSNFECAKEIQICLLFKISYESLKTDKKFINMVLLSLQEKLEEAHLFEIELVIDIQQGNFTIKDQPNFQPIKVENKWHLLIIRLQRSSQNLFGGDNLIQMDVFVDSFDQFRKASYPQVRSDPKAKFYLALGNSTNYCLTQSQDSQRCFQGRCSLPLFCYGLPDQNKINDQELANRALRESIIEFINTKQLVNRKELDLNPYILKYAEERGQVFKPQKKYRFQEFQIVDQFTQPAIVVHQLLKKHGYLCAVHQRKASEVLVAIGGFKNMYPIVKQITKSNLLELGRAKPGHVFSQFFRILGSFLNQEPGHMQNLMHNRNLIPLLKYCVIKIGKYQMITQEMMVDVKNIIRYSVRGQVSFSAIGEKHDFNQRTQPNIKNFMQFFSEFLKEFTHQILLDYNILSMPCYIMSKNSVNNSSNSSVSGISNTTLVFNELVELIHQICCPTNLVASSQIKQTRGPDIDIISEPSTHETLTHSSLPQTYTDYSILNKLIVCSETVPLLIQLINNPSICQLSNLQLLNQIGESISQCILNLDDKQSLQLIILRASQSGVTFAEENQKQNEVQLNSNQYHIVTLLYLQIIHRVIRHSEFKNKKNLGLLPSLKDHFQGFYRVLYQFELHKTDYEIVSEECQILKDQIIAVTLMLLGQVYVNRRTKFNTAPINEKSASNDQVKFQWLKQIKDYLLANTQLKTDAYLSLMHLAFAKHQGSDQIPNADQVQKVIKQVKVFSKSKSFIDVIDFDIDCFFLVLICLTKYTDQTKLLFFNQFMLFQKEHQESFMKVFSGQTQGDANWQTFRNFYYEVIQICMETEDPRLPPVTEQLIVKTCFYQFTKTHDDKRKQYLTENDERDLWLFRRIFVFFDQKITLQLTVLQKILKEIVIDLNTDKQTFQTYEQIKLNLKLIHLLQFFEELYVQSRKELNQQRLFQETLLLFMFLFEQVGLLTLDSPDRIQSQFENQDFDDDFDISPFSVNSNINLLTEKNRKEPGVGKVQSKPINYYNQIVTPSSRMTRGPDTLVQSQYVDDGDNKSRLLSISQTVPKKHETYEGQHDSIIEQRATTNFMPGGPTRIFLHILFNSLLIESNNRHAFTNSIEMLRYLILRERGQFFKSTIQKFFSDNFYTQTVKVYTMFNRPKFMQKLDTNKQTDEFQTPSHPKERDSTDTLQYSNHQQIVDLLQSEKIIFQKTLLAIMKTTDEQVQLEHKADGRKQKDLLPSSKYQQIASKSYRRLKNENRIGFTATEGFLITTLIAEGIEILNQIVEVNNDDNNTISFQMADLNDLSIGVSDELYNSQSQISEQTVYNRKVNQALASDIKYQNMSSLLSFIYDCMHDQFQFQYQEPNEESKTNEVVGDFNQMKDYGVVKKIVEKLIENQVKDLVDIKQQVIFLSQYLEQAYNDDFESVITEVQQSELYQYHPKSGLIITDFSDKTSLKHLQINANYFSHTQLKNDHLIFNTPDKNSLGSPIQDKQEFYQDPLFNRDSQEVNNLIESGKSDLYKSKNDSRQSWVDSIRSSSSPILRKAMSQNSNITESLSDQYRNQIVDFVRQLGICLHKFVKSNDIQLRKTLLTNIIEQTLIKDKQRKFYITFAAATSHQFLTELKQVRVNSKQIFHNINDEINKIYDYKQDYGLLKRQESGFNLMNQSQQLSRGLQQDRMTDFDIQHVQIPHYNLNSNMLKSQNFVPQSRFTNQKIGQSLMMESKLLEDGDQLNSIKVAKYTIDIQFAKYTYKKTCKRLQEDESNIWYDHIEEQEREFKEIKEIYDAIQQKLDQTIETADRRQTMLKKYLSTFSVEGKPSNKLNEVNHMMHYLKIDTNPAIKKCFVAQRRNADSWGRMMLIKPDRKAINYNAWIYYDYFVFDFLNRMFAVSLLNDDDFQDLIKKPTLSNINQLVRKLSTEETKEEQLETSCFARRVTSNPNFEIHGLQMIKPDDESPVSANQNQSFTDEGDQFSSQVLNSPLPYSVYLQRFRTGLLQKMDKSLLLQKVLANENSLDTTFIEVKDLVEHQKEKVKALFDNEKQKERQLANILKRTEMKVQQFEVQNIRVKGTQWGTLISTRDFVVYQSACTATPVRDNLKYVDRVQNALDKKELFFKWENIDEIMKRKVLNIFQGIDIQTYEKKTYTFNLLSEQKCDEFIGLAKIFIMDKKDDVCCRIIENPKTYFNQEVDAQYLQSWRDGQKSNMEFLLLINKYSGRSFNDLSQYPIFPWVVKDYSSSWNEFQEKLKAETCFRDFTQHTGNMSKKKTEIAIELYESAKEDGGAQDMYALQYGKDPFNLQYGFSNKMIVTQWLCRMEPYTAMNYYISDRKRDDRLPIDFKATFDLVVNDKQANTELCPEHFYFPEIMANLNKLDLGIKDQDRVMHQQDQYFLPPWAMNYYDFVRQMRESLESKYVRQNIGYWIDLVFGCNQKDVDKQNLFYSLAYEEWHEQKKNRQQIDPQQIRSLADYFTAPSKLFQTSLVVQPELVKLSETGQPLEVPKITQLIKSFIELGGNKKDKKKLALQQIAVHNILDQSTNIVHMLFNNEKKCLVFVRIEDTQDRRQDTGNLVVYLCQETLAKEHFKEKSFDLQLRYEWVCDDLNNVFQVYYQQANKLFVCGYLDNSLRIFDLDAKPGSHYIKQVRHHNARITCFKFGGIDQKYLITCDSDGLMIHYVHKKQTQKDNKVAFPFQQLYKLQDQMSEILAIDTNQTLDLYVTLSKDGTIAVRCQRTSQLWYCFKIFSRHEQSSKIQYVIHQGFSQNFRHIDALKLSLHGYIILVGQTEQSKNSVKYLVYNLSGDTLLAQQTERCQIKSIFLNATEDQLIVAQNYQSKDQVILQGNIRVFKLYGLIKIANLSQLCYTEVLKQISESKSSSQFQMKEQNEKIPVIQAIAMKKGEASLNIFFEQVDQTPTIKEIICLETSKAQVWGQLEDMALTPRTKHE